MAEAGKDSNVTDSECTSDVHVANYEAIRNQPCSSLQSETSNSTEPDLRSVLVTSVLNLEELDTDLYRGKHHWIPRTRRLFGGQIVGQALVAAAKSVSEHFYAHSLHCYFVRAGDPSIPVLYQVDRTRDGRSFSVRSVKALQHGQPILICQASFNLQQLSQLQHQFPMPSVPAPDALLTKEQLVQRYLSDPDLAEDDREGLNKILADEVPIEIKPVNPPDVYRKVATEPKKLFWVRAKGHIGEGNMKLHCCVAAYVSDYSFLGTTVLPFPEFKARFSASLDHAMWFHNTFRADEWMLYECESPWAGGCRALVQGRLWRQDGVLAATCAQEGVLRPLHPPPTAEPKSTVGSPEEDRKEGLTAGILRTLFKQCSKAKMAETSMFKGLDGHSIV